MTEHFPEFGPYIPDIGEIERGEAAVAQAREAVSEPLQLGSITVAYQTDSYATGDVYVQGDCNACPAQMVMHTSSRSGMRYLALTMARYECQKYGHEHDMGSLEADGQ